MHVATLVQYQLCSYSLTAPQTTAVTHHRPFWGQKEHRLPMHYFQECSGSTLGLPVADKAWKRPYICCLSIFCMYIRWSAAHACTCAHVATYTDCMMELESDFLKATNEKVVMIFDQACRNVNFGKSIKMLRQRRFDHQN